MFAKIVGGRGVATGPGSAVYYAGNVRDASKSIDPNGEFYSARVARIDADAVATVAMDWIVTFKQSQGISPWFIPPPIAPGQMVRVKRARPRAGKLEEAHLNADGRLDTQIGGVQVLFDGVPAPPGDRAGE